MAGTLSTKLTKTMYAADWSAQDPVLDEGEVGTTQDTGVLKVGDGTTRWSLLDSIGATDVSDLTQTWDNGATTYTAIKMNVTDTASAAASLLMDLQVGGVSKLKVRKDGLVQGAGGSSTAFTIGSTTEFRPGAIGLGFQGGGFSSGGWTGGGGLGHDTAGLNVSIAWSNRGFLLSSVMGLGWSSGAIAAAADIELWRDAADTLAMYRGVNPQALRLYNTRTDASNYERGFIRWSGNVFQVGIDYAGTGSARIAHYRGFDANARYQVDGNGLTLVDTAGGEVRIRNGLMSISAKYIEGTEITAPAAPATNAGRLYFEDNGAGKTRLMCLFATGAAQQVAIEP